MTPHPYDQNRARDLLSSEGWRNPNAEGWLEKSGESFEIELLVNQGNRMRENIAVLVQSHLREIGVRARIRTLEWGVFREVREKGEYDGYISAWLASTKVDLKNLLHSSSIGEGGYNYVRYANPEVDALIDRAREMEDFSAATPLWRRVEEILHREQPYTLLFERNRLNAVSSRIQDVRMDTNSSFVNLEEWWVTGP